MATLFLWLQKRSNGALHNNSAPLIIQNDVEINRFNCYILNSKLLHYYVILQAISFVA